MCDSRVSSSISCRNRTERIFFLAPICLMLPYILEVSHSQLSTQVHIKSTTLLVYSLSLSSINGQGWLRCIISSFLIKKHKYFKVIQQKHTQVLSTHMTNHISACQEFSKNITYLEPRHQARDKGMLNFCGVRTTKEYHSPESYISTPKLGTSSCMHSTTVKHTIVKPHRSCCCC